MKDIIRQLFERCDYESVVNYDCSKLWLNFRYGGMMLELECSEETEKKYCFKRVGDFDEEEFCHDVKIGKLYITDPAPYTEDSGPDYDLSWRMFQSVKYIKSKYPTAIKDYHVSDFLMDPYIIEGENLWYSYFIEIAEDYKEDARFVDTVVDFLERYLPENSVNESIYQNLDITPRYDLRHLTTNTKARRLGYFKLMLALFKETPLLFEKPFMKKISDSAALYETALQNYKNNKGVIRQTKTGGGAKPYLDVALGLNLISKIGNGYELGKVSRAYNAMPQEKCNPFEMDSKDKAFFLETILRYDYLYIYSLLEYAYITHKPSYQDIKCVYQQLLLKNIRQMGEGANRADSIKKYSSQTIERRIREWKKPEVYLEHVLMPRLNWLYDLELLDLSDSLTFELTKEGERLFSAISGWHDIEGVPVVDPAPYLDACFMKIYDSTYFCGEKEYLNESEKDQLLTKYLEESFSLFKTFAPNRVTFSVFSNYAKWMLYKETYCVVDIDDIVKTNIYSNSRSFITTDIYKK